LIEAFPRERIEYPSDNVLSGLSADLLGKLFAK
jgi:hypothetical protein